MAEIKTLAGQTCIPCEGGVPRLDIAQAIEMIKGLPEWELNGDGTRITRSVVFKDFKKAQDFANKISENHQILHIPLEAHYHNPNCSSL